jgi:ribulose-phosphate 3-epimerase
VLVMTVNPGFGGQSFIPAALSKIQLLHRYAQERDLKYKIEVDGGINTQTTPLVVNAGARVLVAGSSVFNGAQGIQASIRALRESIGAR